jgi:dihydroflavonol-4-reductase
VLKYGFKAGAERIVMTSSIAAMIGQKGKGAKMTITEDDWSDPDWKPMTAYPISKTRAELAAWDYAKAQGVTNKLTVINPGIVFGPDSYGNAGASLGILRALMIGKYPQSPKLAMPLIDVRDCASIHVAAMTREACGGRRLLATGQTLWMQEIADVLRAEYPKLKKLPRGEIPTWLIKLMAIFNDNLKVLRADIGTFHEGDSAYVTNLTHVLPRPAKQAILAGAESLIKRGFVRLE